jgi:hypothetical protein
MLSDSTIQFTRDFRRDHGPVSPAEQLTAPPDQADDLRALAANLNGLPGPIAHTSSYMCHLVEVVERVGKEYGRYAVFVTPPGGTRFKTDVNWHGLAAAIEGTYDDVERMIQDARNGGR